jgi:hypothetical protein
MADKPHFFISRAGEDAEYATWMAEVLEAEGYTTILQAEALIAETGYHRRDAELESLRQSLGTPE